MTITIDSAGRLVVPKSIRDAAGLRPGMPLEVRFRDGRIEIEPVPVAVDLVDEDGVVVAVAREPVPPLTTATTRAVRDSIRDERG
ncbi:MAG: AbrB/MazE/SpoVT family DNA-binding domain-containing protein [Deltaproteobacteria bacterium]|nr:AbrB/MazE/SpoVT family DNA-binding domain-containing protein [Deltaproteobacteria bacterium]MBW2256801.1 AbrB/MazE/SpoVT family DNA-binding domain-containing protein [Deltaproteobacteria bacterium]